MALIDHSRSDVVAFSHVLPESVRAGDLTLSAQLDTDGGTFVSTHANRHAISNNRGSVNERIHARSPPDLFTIRWIKSHHVVRKSHDQRFTILISHGEGCAEGACITIFIASKAIGPAFLVYFGLYIFPDRFTGFLVQGINRSMRAGTVVYNTEIIVENGRNGAAPNVNLGAKISIPENISVQIIGINTS